MDHDSKILVAVSLVSQAVLLGVIVLQNKAMKKTNAEAAEVVDSAHEMCGIVENAVDSTVALLERDDLEYEEKLQGIHDQFTFVQTVVHTRLEHRKEDK